MALIMFGSNEMVMTLREDVSSFCTVPKNRVGRNGKKSHNKRNEAICRRIPISDERLLKRLAKLSSYGNRKVVELSRASVDESEARNFEYARKQ